MQENKKERKFGLKWGQSKHYLYGIIAVFLLVGLGLFGLQFGVNAHNDYRYNTEFQSHINLAESLNTFQGIQSQLTILQGNINSTFTGNPLQTFGSPFYWSQIYGNSLAAVQVYIQNVQNNIQIYQTQYAYMLRNTTIISTQLNGWYTSIIQTIHSEIANCIIDQNNGGSDGCGIGGSTLSNIWYYNFGGVTWWMPLIVLFTVVETMLFAVPAILNAAADNYYYSSSDVLSLARHMCLFGAPIIITTLILIGIAAGL